MMQESRMRLIGRWIAIGLCVLVCIGTLPFQAARVAAAGYTVTTTSDSGGGSLRAAIMQVNAGTGTGDTITITATGTITLVSGLPALAKPVTIMGPGAGMLTVSGNHAVGVFFVIFFVSSGVTASISNLTIANGNDGGIVNYGTVTVTNSTLSSNNTAGGGGGIFNNGGTVTVTNSTLSSNNSGTFGGGIFNNGGTVTVTNSILSGNNASGSYGGGGILNYDTLTVTNSTLSGNSSSPGVGGGIFSGGGTPTVTNTIVAGNTAAFGPDINGAVASNGHNLIGDTSGGRGFVASDLQNVNPLLDTLKDNGGTTPLPDGSHVMTRALLPGSPAIGAGDSSVCNSTTAPPAAPVAGKDQRGFPRPPTTCAIGAFEPQSATVTITLSPAALPTGTVGVAYSQMITATGGTAPYTFAVTSGALPTGLTLTATGALSGTPSAAGSSTFTVTATDANGFTGAQQYTLTIGAAAGPTLRSIALTGPGGSPPPATLRVGQRVQLTATGAYSDGSTRNLTTQVQWSSSNAAIATVDATGIVTGQSPGGPVTITATLGGVSGTTTVSVTPPTPLGIQPAPAPAARPAGAASSVPPGAPAAPALPAPAPLPPGR